MGKKQLEDFWRDLENLDEKKFHYTGVLTLENISKGFASDNHLWQDDMWLYERGLSSYYIIDGQQRLLTSMILLFAVLERFDSKDEINYTSKELYLQRYFYQTSSRFRSFIFGYKSDDPSDVFFRKCILGETGVHEIIEETLYTANMKYAKEFFQNKLSKKNKGELEVIVKKLTNGFRYNIYEIDDELDVFVTFETMNNRGKLLSKLELLKDRLIYISTLLKNTPDIDKTNLRNNINKVWKKVYTFLGKNKDNLLPDDTFLLRHWSIFYKVSNGSPSLDVLLDNYFIVDNVYNERLTYEEIDKYINSISECVESWFYIKNSHLSPYSNDIKEYLQKIVRLKNAVFEPMLMAICARENNEDKILESLKAIERYIFLVFVATDRKATTGDSVFCRKACEYYMENSITIDEVIFSINDFVNDSNRGFDLSRFTKEINELFERENGKGYYEWDGLRYLLYEYELFLTKENNSPLKIAWENISLDSIDHIFPQSSTYKHGTQWGRILGQYRLNNKMKKHVIHALGNLLLLSKKKNSELQGTAFEYRKEHTNKNGVLSGYKHGSYSENEVATYQKWTPDEIFERGIKLLTFFEKRWAVAIIDKEKLLNLEFLVR